MTENSNCSPAGGTMPAVDLRNATSCIERLRMLLNAYEAVMTGSQTTIVRFQERWVEYQKGNVAELRNYYQTLYVQCPGAQAAGLPSLSVSPVRRGPPARGGFNFGRL